MLKVENRTGGVKGKLKHSKFCKFHEDKSVFARGLCKNCYDKWLKKNNPEYLESQKKNCREWSEQHADRKKQYDANYKVKRDPDYNKIRSLKRYGMTPDDYDLLLNKQNGVCAICGKEPGKRRFAIDHDHNTGTIRGLLCFRCNFGLTYFSENHVILHKASKYLEDANVRGQCLTKELADIIERRDNVKKREQQQVEDNLLNSPDKTIPLEVKLEIKQLYNQGMKLKELQKLYPQYSRSAIRRATKVETN